MAGVSFFSRIVFYSVGAVILAGGFAYYAWEPRVPLRARWVTPMAVERPVHREATRIDNPTPFENEMTQTRNALEKQTAQLLADGKYAELDGIAAEFRKSEAQFVNGIWKLSLFYECVAELETDAPEMQWQTHVALLQQWFENDPDSITARVAMARALVGYAWHARGSGWASGVSKNAWQTADERIVAARRILDAARDLPEKCPCWYSTWMKMAMLDHAPRERYDEIFAEAVKMFPRYRPFVFLKMWYLEGRWYGERGEAEAFARSTADRVGGEDGDILYAQSLWYRHDQRVFGNPVVETGADWPRAQRGFEAILRKCPHSLFALSEYCSVSGFAPNGAARPLMQRLLIQLNNRVDLQVWRSMDLYKRDRLWAFTGH
jgi:hypothetical protein